jgi:NADPH:quinone reductase-like Zn-dependent oxidoreductase
MSYLSLKLTHYGPPESSLQLTECQEENPNPEEAIVHIDAVGMHIADSLTARGTEILKPVPCIPGFEGVGTVKKLGSKAGDLKEGDKVLLPMGTGAMTQQLKIPASSLTKVPEPYAPDAQLALITVNGFTAYFLLRDYWPLKEGDWVIQNAANSNVGRYLIALAKEKGVNTLNIVRRKSLIPELIELGATEVILDREHSDEKILENILSKNIKLAIDAVAGQATEQLAKSISDEGLIVNYGTVTKEMCHISFWSLFRKKITLKGMSTLNGFETRTEERVKEIHQDLAVMANQSMLQTKIAATYGIEDYLKAYRHIDQTGKERDGKIVLLPNN